MGLTFVEGIVSGNSAEKIHVNFLVDSGATYTLLPHDVWQQLGLKPKRKVTFTLTDGTTIQRNVSECYITILDGEGHTPVILGEKGDVALLGAVTLEILGFILDPFKRILQSMHMRLT